MVRIVVTKISCQKSFIEQIPKKLTERLGRPYGPVNRTTLSRGKKDSRLGRPGDRLSAPLGNEYSMFPNIHLIPLK